MSTTLSRKQRHHSPSKDSDYPVRDLRRRYAMPQRLFARLMCVSDRSVAKFENTSRLSQPVQRQVHALSRLHTSLGRVIKPGAIGQWFQTPNPAFGGLKPLEVVERGEIDRIWAMIHQLESGAVR